MPKLEVFFDYICPFCLRGHINLMELAPSFPQIKIEWRPCEAHPRPEHFGLHSDLCARAMYFAKDRNVDMVEFHRRMYQATLTDRLNIEDVEVLVGLTADMLDGELLRAALSAHLYEREVKINNRLVWEVYDCPAVPSYRLNRKLLPSKEGIGVGIEELEAFLRKNA